MKGKRSTPVLQWAAAVASIAAVTALGKFIGLNATTIGFVFLVVVLLLTMWGGLALGLAMSILATACFNFFFLPPYYAFTIEDPATGSRSRPSWYVDRRRLSRGARAPAGGKSGGPRGDEVEDIVAGVGRHFQLSSNGFQAILERDQRTGAAGQRPR